MTSDQSRTAHSSRSFSAMSDLGWHLVTKRKLGRALVVYKALAARFPESAVAQKRLGDVYLSRGEIENGCAAYARAVELDGENANLHLALANALRQNGRSEEARAHTIRAFTIQPVVRFPYRGGRTTPIRLLVIATADVGNIQEDLYHDPDNCEVSVVLAETMGLDAPLPPHDVILNVIGEADLCADALDRAEALMARSGAIGINQPRYVKATTRVENSRRLSDLPGVTAPIMMVIPRSELENGCGVDRLKEARFVWPILFRSLGYHMGEHFVKVDREAELAQSIGSIPGEDLLAIQFIDTSSADGKFRKYRVMMIAGVLFPVHVAVSPNWKVHYFSADMADAANRAEDEAMLSEPARVLEQKAVEALSRISEALNLDFVGVDFGFGPDGDVVVFEANATMSAPKGDKHDIWSYRNDAMNDLRQAFRGMVAMRATRSALPQLRENAVPQYLVENVIRAAKNEFGQTLIAVALSGSRVRGGWHESSDLDVHIVHGGSWHQKRHIRGAQSLFNVALDVTITPIHSLYAWVANSRAYADFYTHAVVVYPFDNPEQIDFVVSVAKRTMAARAVKKYDTEEHFNRYVHLRRIFDYALQESPENQRTSAAYALSSLALLRLFLTGEHHVLNHALSTQVRSVDSVFAEALDACLAEDDPAEMLRGGRRLLETVKPSSDSLMGAKT
jgi:tetratricopeptide (TPR) repeat protein